MNHLLSRGSFLGLVFKVNSNIFVCNSSLTPISRALYEKSLFHSSCVYKQSNEQPEAQVEGLTTAATQVKRRISSAEAKKIAYWQVDWLPFKFERRKKYNPFEESDDQVKYLEYDPAWPKPDFELSEELKTADDEVKRLFSLATANKAQVKEVIKRRWLERIQRHPNDFDSLEVKIALQTLTIRSVFEHQKACPKERVGGRRVLDILIKKRYSKLVDLYQRDIERFHWLVDELKLVFRTPKLGGEKYFYCKKWHLRQLTKEYCANMVQEKKNVYHEELKKQQADFLKEKEETLAWIEKEEKELAELAKLAENK